VAFKKLEQRAKKCTEEYVEYVPILVAAACFLPGRAKDLSAPTFIAICGLYHIIPHYLLSDTIFGIKHNISVLIFSITLV
jgi:hypothetical protein